MVVPVWLIVVFLLAFAFAILVIWGQSRDAKECESKVDGITFMLIEAAPRVLHNLVLKLPTGGRYKVPFKVKYDHKEYIAFQVVEEDGVKQVVVNAEDPAGPWKETLLLETIEDPDATIPGSSMFVIENEK